MDSASEQVLSDLVAKQGLDGNCLEYDSITYRKEGEKDISYSYFGHRLLDLFEGLEDPTPRGCLAKWFQRKSGSRHVMMATLVGAIVAVFLGFLALVAAGFQSWVAYQAWKHPVNGD